MKKIFLLTIIVLVFSNISAQKDKIYYVSPGLNFSWNLEGRFIFSPKISFGFYADKLFFNLTFGYVPLKSNKLNPYYYIENQIGNLSDPMEFRKLQLFSGFGFGIALHLQDYNNISYRASLFTGFGLFIKASFLYNKELYPDLGFEAVLPIPFNESKICVTGGTF